ncbi:tRNA pseudouridine(38-40) synthase TruA [Flavobacteriaceae bacterium PRS1]|nr:tRNA pseudouridine(38-40) synthase TruA [Flavobacteriaceae bacterium PRS1]
MRFFIELSYNGNAYHGWQNQPNAISVQEVLENALSTLLKEEISIVGAGRTDTGVHAIQMFAHFNTTKAFSIEKLIYNLNSFLPNDIAIQDVFKVNDDAHARFDATSRVYKYRISLSKNVFSFNNTYSFKKYLDVDKMNESAKILFEYSNFKCFSRNNTDVKTFNCKIMEAKWVFENNELVFIIKADRFLRNMVRAIVGTMINIGIGKIKAEDLHDIIKSKNRSQAGVSVPGHALYLTKIEYPKNIKNIFVQNGK